MKKSKNVKPVSSSDAIMPCPEEGIELLTLAHSRCDLCSTAGSAPTCIACGDVVGTSATYLTLMLTSTAYDQGRNALIRNVGEAGIIAQFCDNLCWLKARGWMNAKYHLLENGNGDFPTTKCACCFRRIDARQPHYAFEVADETRHYDQAVKNDLYDFALVCVDCGRTIWSKASQSSME